MRMNARLMFSASPKPTASAMRSTGSVVDSMRPRAICESARGPGADRRHKSLIDIDSVGSMFVAVSHLADRSSSSGRRVIMRRGTSIKLVCFFWVHGRPICRGRKTEVRSA
jgi:hypothetical protein